MSADRLLRRVLAGTCSALWAVAMSSLVGAQELPPEEGSFTIGPGDQLNIVVWMNDALTTEVPVRPDGFISLPLLNDIRAAGLTPTALQKKIHSRLQEYISQPEVSVIVKQVRSFKVSVLGKVRSPGRLELDGPATVLDVIAMAGGFDAFSNPDDVYIVRKVSGSYTRLKVKYSSATKAGGQEINVEVQPGDLVIVP